MKASGELKQKIKEFEGLRLKAYQCSAGKWTIGYGHTKDIKAGMICTERIANIYLDCDVLEAERELDKLKLELSQDRYDALIDFVFNEGIGNLKQSTLLKKIRAGASVPEIQRELRKWVYATKKDGTKVKLPGLDTRRGNVRSGRRVSACRCSACQYCQY